MKSGKLWKKKRGFLRAWIVSTYRHAPSFVDANYSTQLLDCEVSLFQNTDSLVFVFVSEHRHRLVLLMK